MRLFLDDERPPPNDGNDWVIARTYFDAVAKTVECWLAGDLLTYVSFDHDLGEGPNGAEFADFLVMNDVENNGALLPHDFTYYVHSQNPIGKANIEGKLEGYLTFKRNHP
ncbi:cyclic-phosphate processing receiver domain-containing protein [Inquilinus limosus]|uniref:Cyclic-phosphate processing Receiver domain-containing protein n=1 Tax=Inquilinus limosus MP06 TaxID=1398085 RepID=A0A0A0DGR3_9PROT|nr:cyclic-phosphate processing receiver domain-containing protein [Inquilinus limosus]KGM36187.1 hypothetical protein P409_00635 [Inquilinus limosus MP06]